MQTQKVPAKTLRPRINYKVIHLKLKGHNTQHNCHKGILFQNELMIEIHSKCGVRSIGRYYS